MLLLWYTMNGAVKELSAMGCQHLPQFCWGILASFEADHGTNFLSARDGMAFDLHPKMRHISRNWFFCAHSKVTHVWAYLYSPSSTTNVLPGWTVKCLVHYCDMRMYSSITNKSVITHRATLNIKHLVSITGQNLVAMQLVTLWLRYVHWFDALPQFSGMRLRWEISFFIFKYTCNYPYTLK